MANEPNEPKNQKKDTTIDVEFDNIPLEDYAENISEKLDADDIIDRVRDAIYEAVKNKTLKITAKVKVDINIGD